MNNLFEIYQIVSSMFDSLTKKICEANGLRKGHRAYLPALDEIDRMGRQFADELKVLECAAEDAYSHYDEEEENEAEILALNGSFFLVTSDFLMEVYTTLNMLFHMMLVYQDGTVQNGFSEDAHDEMLDSVLDMLRNLKKDWDQMHVTKWDTGEEVNIHGRKAEV